jgi:hypothetical protein
MSLNLYPKHIHDASHGSDSSTAKAHAHVDEDEIDEICQRIRVACEGMGTDNQ